MAGLESLYPEFQEFARRSARNLGMGAEAAVDWLAGGAKAGAEPALALYRGDDLDEPFLPTPESGGKSRAGAIASGLGAHLFPGAAPAGSLGTYVGPGAKAVPQRYREFAEKAAGRGMDNEAIRQKYGWFQDPSGDWKFEISDHRAELRVDPNDPNNVKLYHPELRRQYPDLVDTLKIGDLPNYDAFGRPNPTVAEYRRDTNTANINWSAAPDPQEALKVLLHELQHGVQFREGFSPGTAQNSGEIGHLVNTEYWPALERNEQRNFDMRRERDLWMAQNPNGALEDFYKINPDWTKEYDALLAERRNFPGLNDWTFRKYNSALGEVEARDTMNRMDLTPDQRRAAKPYEGEGIPWQDIWDIREIQEAMQPRKVADTPEEPPTLRTLITRHLGLSPE